MEHFHIILLTIAVAAAIERRDHDRDSMSCVITIVVVIFPVGIPNDIRFSDERVRDRIYSDETIVYTIVYTFHDTKRLQRSDACIQ